MSCPFNESDYLNLKEDLIKKVVKDGIDSVTEYCVFSGIPLIIAYRFISIELTEYKEICFNKINQITEFYGYRS